MSIRMINTPKVRARRWAAVLIVAVAAIVVAPQALAQEETPGRGTTDTYVVAEGETLWSIASSLTPPGDDVRDTVATIKEMNLLDSAALGIGDQLIVPLAG